MITICPNGVSKMLGNYFKDTELVSNGARNLNQVCLTLKLIFFPNNLLFKVMTTTGNSTELYYIVHIQRTIC